MKNSGNNNALKAARRMMKERGFVVAGFPPAQLTAYRGDALIKWAGYSLPGDAVLYVTKRTTRKDWDDQHALLFPGREDQNSIERGARFYRCELLESPRRAVSNRGRL